MTPTAFGRKAMGDGRLVARLRNGRQVRATTLARVRQFLSDHASAASEGAASAATPIDRPAEAAMAPVVIGAGLVFYLVAGRPARDP